MSANPYAVWSATLREARARDAKNSADARMTQEAGQKIDCISEVSRFTMLGDHVTQPDRAPMRYTQSLRALSSMSYMTERKKRKKYCVPASARAPWALAPLPAVSVRRGITRRTTCRNMHCHSTGATHPITPRQ
jgi:hypothetical protein